jgi:hypothetical protein
VEERIVQDIAALARQIDRPVHAVLLGVISIGLDELYNRVSLIAAPERQLVRRCELSGAVELRLRCENLEHANDLLDALGAMVDVDMWTEETIGTAV